MNLAQFTLAGFFQIPRFVMTRAALQTSRKYEEDATRALDRCASQTGTPPTTLTRPIAIALNDRLTAGASLVLI